MREFLLLANENGLVAAAAVCVLLALLLLMFLLTQRGRYRAPLPGPRDDFAKMLILFQTMRDLLEQQKELARELNQAIDAKVKFVSERVEAAQADLANMRDEVRELSRAVDGNRRAASQARDTNAEPEQPFDADGIDARPEIDATENKLRLLALPEHDSDAPQRLDSWVGLDLGAQPDIPAPESPPEEPIRAPADPESARDAFKSLLSQDKSATDSQEPAASAPRANPNGEGRITPAIKGRVFEYSEAGMTISQIAKELGIDKGEVRLILSLRDIQDT